MSAHQTLGKLALPTNPSDGNTATLVINGSSVVVRFKNTLAAANDVKIGADAAATSTNLFYFLTNPQITSSTQIAASAGNQVLLGYLSYTPVTTTTYIGSVNNAVNATLTSFSCSTTVSSGVYTANTMTLFIQGGTAYVGGTEVKFAGGLAPTVTAPASNPRIDVLTLDSAGTLAWTTGSEGASPSAPTYPANKLPIVEIYNVVGETSINDNENQTSGQGYVLYDVRPMVGSPLNPTAITSSLLPATTDTYNLGSSLLEWNEIRGKTIYQNGNVIASQKFGGTGTDGALSISSGTTTLSCGSASYFEMNYTSVSITGTGNLGFSNPNNTTGTWVVLRSQGNVTITSSSGHAIDVRNNGGGLGTAYAGYFIAQTGNATSPASPAGGGSTQAPGTGAMVASGTGIYSFTVGGSKVAAIDPKSRAVLPGGNGMAGFSGWNSGSGIGSDGTAGAAGLGGGALYIESGGAYNFTTGTIDASGSNGGAGGNGTTFHAGGSGGGGGAGGNILVLYNSLTADSGSYSLSAGSGGAHGTGNAPGADGAGGAAGSSYRGVNNYFA